MRRFFLVSIGLLILVPAVVASTTTAPATTAPASRPATRPAPMAQDGPGLYRAWAGAHGEFTATFRAKSREDAISIALETVGKKAMDADENVNLNTLKVVKIGN